MVIISNPANVAPDISGEYPDWPHDVRTARWFDDFNRNSLNLNNADWTYNLYKSNADVFYDTDGYRALRFWYNANSGVTYYVRARTDNGLWGFENSQSPYDPPTGIEIEYWDLEVTGDDCRYLVGLAGLTMDDPNNANDVIGVRIGSNIAGQNIVNLVNRNPTRVQTDTFFQPPSRTKYHVRIRYEPARIVDWFVTRSDTGQPWQSLRFRSSLKRSHWLDISARAST